MGLPVLHRSSSCMHAVANTPAEPQGPSFTHFPCSVSLPRNHDGSASALRLSRPARRSLTLRPAYSPSHIMTLYTGGFSRFIASTTAPIATGWSENRRAGFAPAERPCLRTAHMIKDVIDHPGHAALQQRPAERPAGREDEEIIEDFAVVAAGVGRGHGIEHYPAQLQVSRGRAGRRAV